MVPSTNACEANQCLDIWHLEAYSEQVLVRWLARQPLARRQHRGNHPRAVQLPPCCGAPTSFAPLLVYQALQPDISTAYQLFAQHTQQQTSSSTLASRAWDCTMSGLSAAV